MKYCPKCNSKVKIIHQDIIDPADDIFMCNKCKTKTLRYDCIEIENKT